MKKIITLIFLVLLLFSCSDNKYDFRVDNKNILELKENLFKIENDVKTGKFVLNKQQLIQINHIRGLINEKENNSEEIIYKKEIDYNNIDILNINNSFLIKEIKNNELVIDYIENTNYNKLLKIIQELNNLTNSKKVNILDLRCDINYDKKGELLSLLKNMKINTLKINDACLFSLNNYDNNGGIFYDKNKILNFLKNTKYINEIKVGYIDYNTFKK